MMIIRNVTVEKVLEAYRWNVRRNWSSKDLKSKILYLLLIWVCVMEWFEAFALLWFSCLAAFRVSTLCLLGTICLGFYIVLVGSFVLYRVVDSRDPDTSIFMHRGEPNGRISLVDYFVLWRYKIMCSLWFPSVIMCHFIASYYAVVWFVHRFIHYSASLHLFFK